MAGTSLNTGAQLVLLGTPLTGVVSRQPKEVEEGGKVVKEEIIEILVMPTPGRVAEEFTIISLVKELNTTLQKFDKTIKINQESIEKALTALGLGDVKFKLKQCFFYYKKVGEEEPTFEYAFGIEMNNGGQVPQVAGFELFKFEKLFFNIWNTSRKTVLDSMKIWNTQDLLIEG